MSKKGQKGIITRDIVDKMNDRTSEGKPTEKLIKTLHNLEPLMMDEIGNFSMDVARSLVPKAMTGKDAVEMCEQLFGSLIRAHLRGYMCHRVAMDQKENAMLTGMTLAPIDTLLDAYSRLKKTDPKRKEIEDQITSIKAADQQGEKVVRKKSKKKSTNMEDLFE